MEELPKSKREQMWSTTVEIFKLVFVRVISTIIASIVLFIGTEYFYGEEIEAWIEDKTNPKLEYVIKGNIVDDELNTAVSNAYVSILDLGNDCRTDINGNFLIKFKIRTKQEFIILSCFHKEYVKIEKPIYIVPEDRKNRVIEEKLYVTKQINEK